MRYLFDKDCYKKDKKLLYLLDLKFVVNPIPSLKNEEQ